MLDSKWSRSKTAAWRVSSLSTQTQHVPSGFWRRSSILTSNKNLDTSMDATNKTVEWLDVQLKRLKGDLESQEMNLHDFKLKYNLLSVSYDDQSNMVRAEIQQLNGNLTELKAKKEAVSARLAIVKAVDPQDPGEIPATELVANDALGTLRTAYIAAKARTRDGQSGRQRRAAPGCSKTQCTIGKCAKGDRSRVTEHQEWRRD